MAGLGAMIVKAREWLRRALGSAPDDLALRSLFATMLVVTAGLLAVDFLDLNAASADARTPTPSFPPVEKPTPLPAIRQAGGPPLPHFDTKLRASMTFDLDAGGRLMATGTIVPGTARVFAAEIEKRGSYVTTIVLASPGGSVADALAMGRLIREKKFATEVEAEHYCASSCPLVFAGGAVRRAAENAAIGVHQISASAPAAMPAAEGMQDAQMISALCQRYLRDMGVDPEVWIRAMETPSERLFYFRSNELLDLKLATEIGGKLPRTATLAVGIGRGQ